MVGVKYIVSAAVGVLLFGLLAPIGLAAMESYTPTGATLLIVWPLIGVFCVLGVGLSFLWDAMR